MKSDPTSPISFLSVRKKSPHSLSSSQRSPQLSVNPLYLAAEADRAGIGVKDYVVAGLKFGRIAILSCEDPDNPVNFPPNFSF